MDASAQVEVIVGLLAKVGVQVRYEHLGGDGGRLCRIRGSCVLFIDLDADIATTADRCLNALAATPEAEHLSVPPEIRQRLAELRRT